MHTLADLTYKHKTFNNPLILYKRAFTGAINLLRTNNREGSRVFLEELFTMRDLENSTSTIDDCLKRDMELEYKEAQEQVVDFGPVHIAV